MTQFEVCSFGRSPAFEVNRDLYTLRLSAISNTLSLSAAELSESPALACNLLSERAPTGVGCEASAPLVTLA